MLHTNWQSFFAAQADNNLGNKNTLIYTKAWLPDKSNDVRFQTLISDINSIIFAADQDKNIHALHIKVAGGTLLCPTTKLMCLLGSGSSATAFIIDKQSLLKTCNLITPTINELQECSNKDEVNAINAPDDDGAVTYSGSASFFPAPWLSNMVLSLGTSNHAKLIPAVNAAAIEFDTEHAGNANYITTVADHAADFILWAWGAGKGQATATRLTFDPNKDDLEQFKNEQHQQCISQPWMNTIPGGLPPTPAVVDLNGFFTPLLATVTRQVDAQEVQNNILHTHVEHMVKTSGEKKKNALVCVSHGQQDSSTQFDRFLQARNQQQDSRPCRTRIKPPIQEPWFERSQLPNGIHIEYVQRHPTLVEHEHPQQPQPIHLQ
jgi:hypothetical protein